MTLNNPSSFDLENKQTKWNKEVIFALDSIKKEEVMKMVRKKMENSKV